MTDRPLYSIQAIAAKIQSARKEKGLSQRTLSKKVGIPQSHLSKIEKGLVDLQLSTLIEIARTLELEPVLVPRRQLIVVEAIIRRGSSKTSKPTPAYRLSEDEDEE
jgi:transcriptional regulator with XRE-family HTH domain